MDDYYSIMGLPTITPYDTPPTPPGDSGGPNLGKSQLGQLKFELW